MMKRLATLFLFLSFLIWSCGSEDEQESCAFQPELSAVQADVQFEWLVDSLKSLNSKDKLVSFMTRNPVIRDLMFRREEYYPGDSAFINELHRRFQNPHFDTLLMETKRVFADGTALRGQFQDAFRHLKYYYPEARVPKVQVIVTGMDTDLFVSDSLVVVGVDWFLGDSAKYRPKMYDYLLKKYQPEDIVPSVMLLYGIDQQYNNTNTQDKTVIADMIAYGKSYYFAKQMMPCVADSVLIGYTPEEIRGSRKNQDLIWKRFIDDQILFSTSHNVKQKFLGERPKTLEVGEECPGRIGQWVGWEIVKKYMQNNREVTLPQLMQNADAPGIFRGSNYKPKRQ